MRYFTDNPLERLMMQRPRTGGEGKPLSAPQGHFCHGCKRYGDKCVRPCYRDTKHVKSLGPQRGVDHS